MRRTEFWQKVFLATIASGRPKPSHLRSLGCEPTGTFARTHRLEQVELQTAGLVRYAIKVADAAMNAISQDVLES